MRMRRATRAAAATAAALLLSTAAAAPAGGQEAQVLDRGVFDLREGDASVGSETFAIRRERGSVRAVGRIQLRSDATYWRPGQVWFQTDPDFRPQLFRMEPEGGSETAAAVRQEDRLRLQTTSGAGQRSREFVAPAELSVLHTGVTHHLYFLFRQHAEALASGGEARIPAVLPDQRQRVTLSIRREAGGEITVAGQSREAIRYVVEADGQLLEAWTDEQGRILRVRHPADGRTAERTQFGGS